MIFKLALLLFFHFYFFGNKVCIIFNKIEVCVFRKKFFCFFCVSRKWFDKAQCDNDKRSSSVFWGFQANDFFLIKKYSLFCLIESRQMSDCLNEKRKLCLNKKRKSFRIKNNLDGLRVGVCLCGRNRPFKWKSKLICHRCQSVSRFWGRIIFYHNISMHCKNHLQIQFEIHIQSFQNVFLKANLKSSNLTTQKYKMNWSFY